MIIKEGIYERFFTAVVCMAIGVRILYFDSPVIGYALILLGGYPMIRGIFFSPKLWIDIEGNIITHTSYSPFFRKTIISITKDSIVKLVEEDRVTSEEGKTLLLELTSGDWIELPAGAHRKRLKIYLSLSRFCQDFLPLIERRT